MDKYPTCDCAACVAERFAAAVATIMPMTAILTNGEEFRVITTVVPGDDHLHDEED